MNKRLFLLTILLPLAILGSILPGQLIPRAHGVQTGVVCIAAITDVTNKCPTIAPIFNGPFTTPNTLIRVPIMINHTDTFNGFDITVNSTRDSGGHAVLKPFSVDLTGSIMPSNSIPLAECVGTTAIVGNACSTNSTIDNPTTIRAAVIFPSFLPISTTGLLFTAVFSINGTSLPGGVSINFQNHCDPTTSSSGQLCIAIGNGTKSGSPENTQTGSFDNSATATLPYVTLSTPAANLGQSLLGSPAHPLPTVSYTATSQNGFQTSATPQLTLTVKFNGSGTRPTTSLNMTSLDLTNLAAHPFTQTGNVVTNVPIGVYVATVTATYQTADMITFTTDYLSAAYSLPVNVTDYVFNTNLATVSITPPASQPVTATVAPKASFNNPVKLGVTIPAATASAGIGATFSSYTISGGSGTSTLTVTTAANTPGGAFTLTVTSNSTLNGFTISHTMVLTVNTVGFAISATTPPAQTLGTAATSTITVTYFNGFSGTVALKNNTITNLSCLAITPASLSATGTATIQCDSTVRGTYTLTITGKSGTNSLSTNVLFNFTVQIHDVLVTSSVSGSSANVGTTVTVNVTVQNKGAQNENVTVFLLVDNQTITPSQTVIVGANSSKNLTLTWDTTSYAAKAYKLSVQVQLPAGETNIESGQQTINSSPANYTLQSASSAPTFDTTTIAIIAAIIVAIAAVLGTLLVLRKRNKSSDDTKPMSQ